ncbi:hypothetical protein [Vagococcus zengguangii]|uniref:hypothetical protein n=1 Tax=Vagococcus zengguangii TaxID=2571750 RepID=UPI0011091513|nr:hypothetical protein [Vagococcus zengguangii]TLG79833.1 hypothetical protein FE258_07190 [Vagococcus zengguangii]
MSAAAAIIYVINQLLFMALVIVLGFVLFEYRTGLKEAKYDSKYVEPVVVATNLKDNKDHEVYTLVVNQSANESKLELVSVVKYDKKLNQLKLMTIPPSTRLSQESGSIEELYYSEGLPSFIKELEKASDLKMEHYMIMTPYASQLIVQQMVAKTYSEDELVKLLDTAFNPGTGKIQQKAIEVLAETTITQGFAKSHLWRLPKSLGLLIGYSVNDFNLKEISSLAKDITFEEQSDYEFKHLTNNQLLREYKNEFLSFFE